LAGCGEWPCSDTDSIGEPLAGRGADTGPLGTAVLEVTMQQAMFRLVVAMLGTVMPAAADTLTMSNCTTETPKITTYNAMDGFCWIPRSEATLPRCGTVTFTCDGECKLKIEGLAFNCSSAIYVLSGAHTYQNQSYISETSRLRGLNDSVAWKASCSCDKAQMQW
jgi:hypothetical protein